ncbi:ABC transporter ATP-binding protein [Desertifilum sp. FACHB-1129]|uniref:Nitrate ABC transporter ATP-binding protein n=1 Tax=Desertifilum tharense IPPAS B-1220 TaxID=1781255 RepID=A0A1E5QPW3_9CYAN|nr:MULTISPECIES: ABC transporter ATP-binding protein [Desertifilum]MDA0209849.1 ABC transporter ATP-binding protein [Cyanobacteria bacterium FC1]MBD2310661.1 ABC transporter ATP-binding protein [Desertifilum sp. FACHB-1129]MBD2320698.1 ABC transporter ATP-binding protein [Desertifilum sp. FACHB-866]MBD2330826.1 ABC transporter ATP-binding protein [Desertifilum sp. FACHB-868]OEJ76627.1 nitrate ABC transporter ATP-binding protein [Desertifilum tharense IPPAS B-1220]
MLDIEAIATAQSEIPVLEFQQVCLEYALNQQRLAIIEEVTFSIERAEFISIVGPSGCGKTSLLRMISGLHPATQGTVRFRGQPIVKPLKNVGIAFQKPVLLPWRNTLQNVLLPLEVVPPYKRKFRENLPRYTQAAQELLATVGLSDFKTHYPWQLSGGMQQRASLCRALIHQPEILLLDEPFGALDAFTREEMWVMMQALWQKTQCTAVLVTHDLREAIFLSDKVYVMGPRPSRIIYELQVDLPRPRTLETCLTDEFNHLFAEVRRHIRRG